MGQLADRVINKLKESSDARETLKVASMDDTRVKAIKAVMTLGEMELKGLKTDGFSMDDVLEGRFLVKGNYSMDDLSRFTDRQLEHFDTTMRMREYGPIDILKVLQVTSIPVGATQHTYFQADKQGAYKRISGSSRDLPVSFISGNEDTIKIEMGGGVIEWNQQEMDAFDFAGIDYQMEKFRSIRRNYLEDIYDIVVNGNENLLGLNQSAITESQVADSVANPNSVSGAALKYWVNKSGREIVLDLSQARRAIHVATQGVWGGPMLNTGLDSEDQSTNPSAYTCLLPLDAYNLLYEKFMHLADGGTNITVWEYLSSPAGMRATGISQYWVVLDFDSGFNNGTDSGFMLLPNSSEAYSFVKPLDLTPMPIQFQNLSMIIPYYDYFGGMKLIRDDALIRRRTIQLVS